MDLSVWEAVFSIFWGALGIAWALDAVLRRLLGRWKVRRHPEWYDDAELRRRVTSGDTAWESGYLAGQRRVWQEVGRLTSMSSAERARIEREEEDV